LNISTQNDPLLTTVSQLRAKQDIAWDLAEPMTHATSASKMACEIMCVVWVGIVA